jgi:hypothetical protein
MKNPLKPGLSMPFAKNKKRKQPRENKTLPVKVVGDNVKGVTRDLSAAGVYFEINSYYQVGSSIKLIIEFDSPQGMQFECEGTIVRVEDHGSRKMGVAVRMNPRRSRLMHSPEDGVKQDVDAPEPRERTLDLNERPSAGVIRCANPQSPQFGQPVGKCEFSTHNACDQVDPLDKGFGCKYAVLNHPPKVPPTGKA